MNVSRFLSEALDWAEQEENIRCMVLVGSHARGTARADSDVDLVVMAADPQVYIRDHTFASRFGRIDRMQNEDWGRVTSVRVFYEDSLEVEFSFTDPSWCSLPLDAGTQRVLTDGYRVMADKDNRFVQVNLEIKRLAGREEKKSGKAAGKEKSKNRRHGRAAYGAVPYRSEAKMTELILDTAENDERIRAVVMNGSRTDPDAPKDRFQDYDIVYVVNDLKSFTRDHSWVDVFGERIILQMPETMDLLPPYNNGSFNYQMLFTDGNRIDLTLIPVAKVSELLGKDSLTVNLLDKDGILPPTTASNNSSYHIKPPTEKLYSDCCNEFWWVLQNVAKGILRDEMPYSMRMFEYARDMLDQMICWHIGGSHDFMVSAGKCGKYFKKYLSERHYKMYTGTYTEGKYGKLWKAVFEMCRMFREMAKTVAEQSLLIYPEQDDRRMSAYLESMRELWQGQLT
ncbi:MAG TPA: aminoglycoside 6-adenylyltransferase [Clostridia bacterium]|nr:aminoglycoside 6-adenylyltransferase [Clostridia bacterium]